MKKTARALALTGFMMLFCPTGAEAQEEKAATEKTGNTFIKDRKLYLNEDGSNFIKFTFLTQAWARAAEYNPGTTINGYAKSSGTDIGIRRYRVQLFGQLTDKVFIYSQFGENNFNGLSERKTGFFVHDAYGEYALDKRKLSLGLGLSGWNGLSRFASPSVGSILGIDAPLYQQTTNDVTDQFVRKLSIFAKGKLGKLDYRVQMAQPMLVSTTPGEISGFSAKPPKMQYNGYVMYQFKDEESNMTPYTTGTYLGKKNVLNVGVGLQYQKDAMWRMGNSVTDTINSDMVHLSADVYYDAPVKDDGSAISVYGAVTHLNYGRNYTRNSGPLNPANGSSNPAILNSGGVGFPLYGTGTVLYGQAGYKFKDNLIGSTTLMPYASVQYSDYERLHKAMVYYDIGVNWYLAGHVSKFTLSYQNRPVFYTNGDGLASKNAVIAQYQVFFN